MRSNSATNASSVAGSAIRLPTATARTRVIVVIVVAGIAMAVMWG
jgi:hypothetical protein